MSSPEAGRIVVIGVGNEFRRDDGIGPEVVSRLRERAAGGVELVISDGDPTRMIEVWTGARLVVVVDAVQTERPSPGRLHRIVIDGADLPGTRPVSSHGLGPGDAVALARALGRMPERLIVHVVEAADVGHGLGLTAAVAAAAGALTDAVLLDLLAAAGPRASGTGDS
ncbi:MAG TPA: hydrogenase maturation protease [Streptosporangiaceae bacterium]|nr:hydrogenase maturation protease [Streptosporangiaceae bacterium]